MEIRKRIFGNKLRVRRMYEPGTVEYDVAELCYWLFLELTRVTYSAINRAYPKLEREKNPKIEYLWATAHDQAKEFLTRYKNLIRDAVIPIVKITKQPTPYDAEQDRHTQEFRALIVDNNFLMLYTKLRDFGPLMLPEEHIESYNKVLESTYNSIKEKLLDDLRYYSALGVLTEETVK